MGMVMKSSVIRSAIASIVFGFAFSPFASADLAIQFSTNNGASFSNSLQYQEGDVATIEVYLTDSEVNGAVATDGLQAFELFVESSTSVSSITSASLQFPFEDSGGSTTASDSFVWDAQSFVGAPTGQQILLGSFDIIANTEGQSIFTASDNDTANDNWLRGGSSGSFSFTVVAVPEPSSLMLGMGLIALCASQRRRR
jgi:hypothetical protein